MSFRNGCRGCRHSPALTFSLRAISKLHLEVTTLLATFKICSHLVRGQKRETEPCLQDDSHLRHRINRDGRN